MAITGAGWAVVVMVISGYALSPSQTADPGSRVESDSFTDHTTIARCISYNINKKFPDLLVRHRPSDTPGGSAYLVLSHKDLLPKTFGVIRVDRSETGSHLTTWLPTGTLSAAPNLVAQKLIAGC